MDFKVALDTGLKVSTQEFYSNLGKRYEDTYGHNEDLQEVVRYFLSLLPPSTNVLDCGCGTGKPVSSMISASGRHAFGIDLSPTMVEISKKQVPQGIFQACNMLEYDAAPSSFGGATAILSLFGLSRTEITTMTRKFYTWLQPGGHLLFCVFGAEDCKTRPEQYDSDGECAHGVESVFMGHTSYMTLFTKSGWTHMLEDTGFEIAHTRMGEFETPADAVCDDDPYFYVIARKPTRS